MSLIPFRSAFTRSLLILITLVLTACASGDRADVQSAATAPLTDLNLIKQDIPSVLLDARAKPYAVPVDTHCAALAAEVTQLDEVLGDDIDAPDSDSEVSTIKRGSRAARKAAVGAIRSTTEGVIPFRSWVRKITGAERYSKKAAEAVAAGMVRRAFLKGFKMSRGCDW